MENKQLRSFLMLLVFAVCLFALHFLSSRISEICFAPKIYEAHIFLFVLTVAVILVLNFLFKKMKQKAQGLFGYFFMASSIVKMALAVVFLIPIINTTAEYRLAYIIQFFVLYFAYLFMEVYMIAKQLRETQDEKKDANIKEEELK